jgi:hypothetical protein
VVTGFQHATQDVAELGFVINQAQQRLAACALHADAEDILRRRVEISDQQAVINEDNARAQAIENSLRIVAGCSVAAGTIALTAA